MSLNINYNFKNKSLMEKAFNHPSYANEHNTESNQRLEFLGDSILSFIVASYIYDHCPDLSEGKLTELRASVVCESSLCDLAKNLNLGESIRFGGAESNSDGANKPSILADTFEALLGAIYLDSDYETAKKWCLNLLTDVIENPKTTKDENYKSLLQEFFQKRDKTRKVVEYHLVHKTGPDHDPYFHVEAVYEGHIIGKGEGKNRKQAEQLAAKKAYKSLN